MKALLQLLATVCAVYVILTASAKAESVEWEFQTTVFKQLSQPGVLDALRSAKSISVQMIEYSRNARGSALVEGAFTSTSKAVVLTSEQRAILLALVSDEVEYQETRANCDCIFDPQMRVSFEAGTPIRHYDILLSGLSHGEIGAYENAKPVAIARTWTFIPRYLDLIADTFPDYEQLPRLQRHYKEIVHAFGKKKPEHDD